MVLVDLRWHARALLAQARWRRTQIDIARWLAQAPGGFDDLLLFGASAGWMMDDAFLARFRRIDAVDFEWAASPLFRLRHAGTLLSRRIRVTFHRLEALDNLEHLLALRPQALVLFDNILGQYTLTCPDIARVERTLGGLQRRLRGRAWGSLHDALSGPGRRLRTGLQPASLALPAGAPWPDDHLLAQVGGQGTWRDHLTRQVLPAAASTLIPWQLTPGYWHWLQAGWVTR
ncbi:MAG: hypothetical protein RIS88_888 [Pseudomonadota bacterium]